MGAKLSKGDLKHFIEEDLTTDLNLRFLFSLSTTIKQEASQAVFKVPIKYIPNMYEFDSRETEATVVVKTISKK
jgi:hypothetical protein